MTIAAEAFELIGDRPDVALLELVRTALVIEARQSASVPWATLIDEFLETKQTRSPKHRRNLRYTRGRFSVLNERSVSEITPDDLTRILNPLLPATRNLEIRHLKSIFRYGIKRGWISANPVLSLELAELGRREVECFTAHQVQALFDYAYANDPELIPFFAFGFFCGIRPEGELQKLDWSCVHFDGAKPEVEIPPGVSKTKRRRFVDLNETVLAWINAYRQNGGATEGRLITSTPAVLRKKRRAALKATRVKWIQQGMRHSFCSAWLARHHDVNQLVLMSGHDDPETMWRFYHRGMSQKEASKYWAVRPPVTDTNKIVEFQANA
jgi:integrase